MGAGPVVCCARDALVTDGYRQYVAAAVWLVKITVPILKEQRIAIGESAHAFQRAEIMIERAVLLHENDNVSDIVDRSRCLGLRQNHQGSRSAGDADSTAGRNDGVVACVGCGQIGQ